MNDNVKHPRHYEGDGRITCKDAARSMMHGVNFCGPFGVMAGWWFTAFRYIWRWPHKGGVEDLRKCRECLDIMIATIEEAAEGDPE